MREVPKATLGEAAAAECPPNPGSAAGSSSRGARVARIRRRDLAALDPSGSNPEQRRRLTPTAISIWIHFSHTRCAQRSGQRGSESGSRRTAPPPKRSPVTLGEADDQHEGVAAGRRDPRQFAAGSPDPARMMPSSRGGEDPGDAGKLHCDEESSAGRRLKMTTNGEEATSAGEEATPEWRLLLLAVAVEDERRLGSCGGYSKF